jgi:hypothetical protein
VEQLTIGADKANEVIGWKSFSWTRLFNLLEEVLPHEVQMVSIRPVFRPEAPGKAVANRERTTDVCRSRSRGPRRRSRPSWPWSGP